jgi:hypothetical protein
VPRVIADGVPGLEVTHLLERLFYEGPNYTFMLNDRDARPSHVRLTEIKGWSSLDEGDDNREARVGRRGENIYPSAARGKTIVYVGELRSKTLTGMRQLISELSKVCSTDRSGELHIKIQDPDVPWFYDARVIDLEIDDKQDKNLDSVWPWTRAFQLSLRSSDGRFYVDNGGSSHGGNASGALIHVNHEGSSPTDPAFTVHATGGLVLLSNLSIKTPNDPEAVAFCQLRLEGVPAGILTVNFATREILLEGSDASKYMNIGLSNWWDEDQAGILPGDNELTVTGGEWGVSFLHASEG